MSTNWRQRVLERNRAANDQYFAQHESPHGDDDEYETTLRQNWLDAARHYDPQAHLREELTLRLQGELADGGALNFRIADALLKPLREGVSAAARKDVDLELVGISQGSTVLHVQPAKDPSFQENAEEIARVDSSAADPAMRDLLKLIDAAENEQDVRPWERMVQGLDGVVEALDRFDLSMDVRWCALDGAVRSSRLTQRGKVFVRNLRNVDLVKTRNTITGRVTELRESGVVKIKTGTSRRSAAYEVRFEPHDLIGMHLELGVTVSFAVEKLEKRDKIGRVRSTEYRFLRVSDAQGELPHEA
ncbi:hypothetical protein ACIPXV_30255 [Streptomyces libani]|uniref:hypothetical protein n=1 Tax=Streptomyces nigrescens TaxID=1920 RepID=UPI003802BF3B